MASSSKSTDPHMIEGLTEKDWDDTVLMNIFKETLSSHRTADKGSPNGVQGKKNRKKASGSDKEKEMREATPGAWEPVVGVEIDPNAEHSSSISVLNESDAHYEGSLPPHGVGSSDSVLDRKIEEAHAAMLNAYYQMGIATGRYEALLEMREGAMLGADREAEVDEESVENTVDA